MAKRRAGKVALGTIIGVGVGYAAGILTAPKSGKQTRRQIQKQAIATKAKAERNLKKLHSELGSLINAGKKHAKANTQIAKQELSNALTKAQNAKQKSREMLSALHEGEADDKDLDAAITEGKKALNHLRKYIGKDGKKQAKQTS